ncbi:MAG: extracellular solute-binding protein, partial [Epulopiscium sp.]|nr:extracellular solute-binding protein [Candidatus Epulonipiscium sp.]
SGSAYTQLITMLLGHGGKEDGWEFIEKLYDNLDGKILDSSGKCHKMVADGEFHVGITIEKSALLYAENDSVGFIYPEDGTSAVPDGISLIKGAPNEENAKIFIDFVTSKEFQEQQNKNWGRRPVRNDIEIEGMAKLSDIKLVDYDFDWAANEKEAIIERFNDIMVD